MKNKLIMLVVMILIVVPLISAQTYQQNKQLDLKIPFEVNGSIPSANANCNVSINYPDGSYLIRNNSMTNLKNGEFNITLTSENVSKVGEHKWVAFCCDGDKCAAGYGNFIITPSGSDTISTGESLVLILSIGTILILSTLFFIFSFKSKSFIGQVIFGGLALVFVVVVVLLSMVSIGQVLGGYSTLIESYSSFLWVALFLFVIVFIFLMLCLIKRSIELMKIRKGFI